MTTSHVIAPIAAGHATLVLRGPSGPVYGTIHWPRPPALGPPEEPERPHPVAVVVSPRSGAPAPPRDLARSLTASGHVVLSLTVPPPGETSESAVAVRTAVEWLADHARDLDGDPARLLLVDLARGRPEPGGTAADPVTPIDWRE